MNIPTDIPLCPSAHDALRRCLDAAQRSTLHAPSPAPAEHASAPPLCCCRASLRGRPAWPFPAAQWDARKNLASVLTNQALRRNYAAQAIREAQVSAIIGKDLSWGLVFYRLRNRQYARLYVIPANPITPPRQRMWAIMRAVSHAANTLLTPEQRRAWITAGEQVLSRRRLTRGPLTWQNLFVKLNTVLTLAGRELLLWPPKPVKFGPNRAVAVVPSYDHGQFRLALKVSGPGEEDLMVFGEAPVGPKRNKLRHPVYLGLLPASADGLSDITAQYVGCFGEPAPGRKVLLGVQPQANGWKGRMKVLGEVVPARPTAAPRNTRTTRQGAGVPASCRLGPFRGLGEVWEVPRFQWVTPTWRQRGISVEPRNHPRGHSLVHGGGRPANGHAAEALFAAGFKTAWERWAALQRLRPGPKPTQIPPPPPLARHLA